MIPIVSHFGKIMIKIVIKRITDHYNDNMICFVWSKIFVRYKRQNN